MDKHSENPYLPGIEPEEIAEKEPVTEPLIIHEPITVRAIRSLVLNKQRGQYAPKEIGRLYVFPNTDDKGREVFGYWREMPDGSLKVMALEPPEQEIAQQIASDDEIVGYSGGHLIYENTDSQPKYR